MLEAAGIDQVIGKRTGVNTYACMNALLLPDRQVFVVDTHVNYDPSPEELAEITTMAAEEMMRFGIKPKAALLSHSNFGSADTPSARKMRQARDIFRSVAPHVNCDGEMHGDAALLPSPFCHELAAVATGRAMSAVPAGRSRSRAGAAETPVVDAAAIEQAADWIAAADDRP